MQRMNRTSTPEHCNRIVPPFDARVSPVLEHRTPERYWRPTHATSPSPLRARTLSPQQESGASYGSSGSPGSQRSPGSPGTPGSSCPGGLFEMPAAPFIDAPGSAYLGTESSASSVCPSTRSDSPVALQDTPAIQQRDDPVRRFTCKRQLQFGESCDTEGTCGLPDKEDLSEGASKAFKLLPIEDCSVARKAGEASTRIVEGPRACHIYVPVWIMFSYNDCSSIFDWVLAYYFKKKNWPATKLIPDWYINDLRQNNIDLDAYQTTSGFAPVWMFLLNQLSKAGRVDKEYFDMSVDMFFQEDALPALSEMPDEVQWACEEMGVGDYDFYDS